MGLTAHFRAPGDRRNRAGGQHWQPMSSGASHSDGRQRGWDRRLPLSHCPSYHAGPLKNYLPMEGGLLGATLGMKTLTKNGNFTYAGVLDGATRDQLWKFKAGLMINRYQVAPKTGRLYVGSQDNHIYDLDLASGEVIWSHDMGGNILGISLSDDALVAVSTKNTVRAFDPADGHQVWEKLVNNGRRTDLSDGEPRRQALRDALLQRPRGAGP